MIQFSILKEWNVIRGYLISAIITLVSYIIIVGFFFYGGTILYADIEFVLGTIFGVIFTLNNRQEDQSIMATGAIVGIVGGIISSALIGLYQMILAPHIFVFVYYFGTHIISGIAIGLIGGAFIATYYMYKEIKGESKEEDEEDDFFKDLIEK